MSWSLTAEEPGPARPESHLEQSFRKVFTERVQALGATVKETPGPNGNRLTITFPGGARQWILEPQAKMGSSRPDFVLRSSQASLPPVAIFTDGWLYHAPARHNRIADDAQKRQDPARRRSHRARRHRPGHGEAEADTPSTPSGGPGSTMACSRELLSAIGDLPAAERGGHPARPHRFPDLLDPEPGPSRAPGTGGPAAVPVRAGRQAVPVDATADLARQVAALLRVPGLHAARRSTARPAWWWRDGTAGMLVRTTGEDSTAPAGDRARSCDDRAETIADRNGPAAAGGSGCGSPTRLRCGSSRPVITARHRSGREYRGRGRARVDGTSRDNRSLIWFSIRSGRPRWT